MRFESKVPAGNITEMWTNRKFSYKLVNPANKRKFEIIYKIKTSPIIVTPTTISVLFLRFILLSFCQKLMQF